MVNRGFISIEADSNVTNSSTIDFKKDDGSTTVFSAVVQEKKEKDFWNIPVYSNGYELHNFRVENVYENISPEDIVQDIIDNRSANLTFASTATSGVTLTKYIANEYAIDVIKEMMRILQWQIVIDESGNVFFEPKGTTNNGVTFTNGENIQINEWNEDKTDQFNHVKVIGGFENFDTTDTFTGNFDTVTLTNKPTGTMKITIAGTELSPDVYDVDAPNKTVDFDATQTDPVVAYSYSRPIIVDDQDDDSILEFEEIFQEIQAPFLDNLSDARRYAGNLLEVFSEPQVKVKGTIPSLKFDIDEGETVVVTDSVRNKTETLVISKLTYIAEENSTIIECGERDFVLFDWQREVQDRIKKIERRFLNEEEIIFARTLRHNMSITLSASVFQTMQDPQDSFVLRHQTLSRLRVGLNFEADCSDNGNNGIWTGTGIDGNQFSLCGWRLSAGDFNGSDRIITVTDAANLRLVSDFTIALAVRVASLPGAETYILNKWDGTDGYAIRINASNQVELIYSDSGADSTITASTALTANVWQHIIFTKIGTALVVYIDGSSDNTDTGGATIGTNTEDFVVGEYSTNFFSGKLDEIRVYDAGLSSAHAAKLQLKNQLNDDLVCYLSMDNPRLGDRFLPKILITGADSDLAISEVGLDLRTDGDFVGGYNFFVDTTNKRIAQSSSSNKGGRQFVTTGVTKKIFCGGREYATATVTATETKFGGDLIKYFLSPDGGSNWEEATQGVAHTFINKGNDIRLRITFIGNGGSSTYVEDVQIAFTRT